MEKNFSGSSGKIILWPHSLERRFLLHPVYGETSQTRVNTLESFFPIAIQEALPCARNSSTCCPTCNTKSTWSLRHPVGAPSYSSWESSSCWSQYSLCYRETHSRAINRHPTVRAAKHGCSKPGELKSCPWEMSQDFCPTRKNKTFPPCESIIHLAGQKSKRVIHQDQI